MAGRDDAIWLRPERAGVGRPAERSRAEITAAALALADSDGLDAVSMRRVAAGLGTGPGSLYRYVATRGELLDMMVDATAAEYRLGPPTGNTVDDLVDVAEQARAIMRRHPWLPGQLTSRSSIGPHGAVVLEYVLGLVADRPGDARAKLELFAVLMGLTALFTQNELTADPDAARRQADYLTHLAGTRDFPALTALLAGTPAARPPDDPFRTVLRRVVAGLLGD
ncbi:MAG TPA: TetR family transcriptional regulator [Actinocatenispora sp.]